jgi:hypothetical protein
MPAFILLNASRNFSATSQKMLRWEEETRIRKSQKSQVSYDGLSHPIRPNNSLRSACPGMLIPLALTLSLLTCWRLWLAPRGRANVNESTPTSSSLGVGMALIPDSAHVVTEFMMELVQSGSMISSSSSSHSSSERTSSAPVPLRTLYTTLITMANQTQQSACKNRRSPRK